MIVSLIAAAAENDVIGAHGALPWKLPADLKRFRALTSGHAVIMGRKTYESIGRPLPKRRNIVVTHQADFAPAGCEVVHSLGDALALVAGEADVFVIGGGEIYRQALPLAHRIHLTRVHAAVEGDTSFPALDALEWREVARDDHAADGENQYAYTFLTYEKAANQ